MPVRRENGESAPKPKHPFIPPPLQWPSPEEIARRQRVFAETFAFRARLTPLNFPTVELLEEDEDDDQVVD